MKVLLNLAISPNGFIAREDGDGDWLSSADWNQFLVVTNEVNNIVMGRETYEQVTARYKDYNFNNIDEIPLTINPYIIAKGHSFIEPDDFDLPFKLIGHEEQSGGIIKIKYEVTR
jgi:dihydrofolate reductase